MNISQVGSYEVTKFNHNTSCKKKNNNHKAGTKIQKKPGTCVVVLIDVKYYQNLQISISREQNETGKSCY